MLNQGGRITVGSTVFLAVFLTDQSGIYVSDVPYGTAEPITSPATVTITLTTPSGQTKVSAANMTPDTVNIGNYTYTYQSSATDEQGPWNATFAANDGVGDLLQVPSRTVFRTRRELSHAADRFWTNGALI